MIRRTLTAAALALALPLSAAQATEPVPDRSELEAARQDLADAARRVAELSRSLGAEAGQLAIERIDLGGAASRPRLGLVIGTSEDRVVVRAVTPEGPAAEAGVRSGDRLLAIDGAAVDAGRGGLDEARRRLSDLEAGQSVQLSLDRDGEALALEVEARPLPPRVLVAGSLDDLDASVRERLAALGNLRELGMIGSDIQMEIGRILPFAVCDETDAASCPQPRVFEALRWRSLNMAAVEPSLGRYFGVDRGVLVVAASAALPALEAGDVILAVDGEDVDTPSAVMRRLSRHEPGQTINLRIQRDRQARDIAMPAPERAAPGERLRSAVRIERPAQ